MSAGAALRWQGACTCVAQCGLFSSRVHCRIGASAGDSQVWLHPVKPWYSRMACSLLSIHDAVLQALRRGIARMDPVMTMA